MRKTAIATAPRERQRRAPTPANLPGASPRRRGPSPAHALTLQRAVGNRAATRTLARQPAAETQQKTEYRLTIGLWRAGTLKFEVLSFSWGTHNPGKFGPSTPGHAHDITVTKYVDRNSPKLLTAVASGDTAAKAVIVMRGPSGSVTWTMTDVIITSYQPSGVGPTGRPIEELTLDSRSTDVKFEPRPESPRSTPVPVPYPP